jgi:hypothetical protein
MYEGGLWLIILALWLKNLVFCGAEGPAIFSCSFPTLLNFTSNNRKAPNA